MTEFFKSRAGQVVGVASCLIGVGLLGYMIFGGDGKSAATAGTNTQTWIDVDGNAFAYELKVGDVEVRGPTGKPAFRAELCFWTRDGKTKAKPTPVLLNSHVGKSGATFCPDCDRLVVPLNPPPLPGVPDDQQRVPPTRSEYESRAK